LDETQLQRIECPIATEERTPRLIAHEKPDRDLRPLAAQVCPNMPVVVRVLISNPACASTALWRDIINPEPAGRPRLHRALMHANERALTMCAFYAQPCILSHGSLDPISACMQPFPLFR
jgi:hypothetical protein